MWYFWWGCRGNVKLITLGSERMQRIRGTAYSLWRRANPRNVRRTFLTAFHYRDQLLSRDRTVLPTQANSTSQTSHRTITKQLAIVVPSWTNGGQGVGRKFETPRAKKLETWLEFARFGSTVWSRICLSNTSSILLQLVLLRCRLTVFTFLTSFVLEW